MEIIIAIAMLTGVFCYYQNNKIVITNIKLKQKINNKVRIAQISDLHSKEFGKNILYFFQTLYYVNLIFVLF